MAYTHRWATKKDANGDTFCVKPLNTPITVEYNGYVLVRTGVSGAMSSRNLLKACNAKKMRPGWL